MRAGCDAVMLDLHGAMVIEDATTPKARSCSACGASRRDVPIAVTLDYHTNLSRALVEQRDGDHRLQDLSARRQYAVGRLAAEILVRALDGEIEPVMAWGWRPLLASVMRHAPEDGPSGDIVALARAQEANGDVLAATWLPSFPHADTPFTGVSAVVVGDARHGGTRARAQAVCDANAEDGVGPPRRIRVHRAAARRVGRAREGAGHGNPGAPVLLIDHCDNCGSGGAQDVMTVVAEDAAPGARRHCHRADPRSGRGCHDDRRGRRPARQAGARRPHRHAVDRTRRRAADGRRPRACDHRRRVRHHRPDVHRHAHVSSAAPRSSTPATRRSSSPSARTSRSTSACSRMRASTRAQSAT